MQAAIDANQIWLDGMYMAQPFYMAYEAKFDGMAHVADITRQFQNVRKYLYNPEKGLNYHAYDEARVQFWADKETGCSKNFWLRSTGWYLMALVDCIALCSEQLYEHYRALVDIFRESMRGVLAYRAEDGLFYQVIDYPEAEGNYTETSGSAMIAYSLLKGVRIGVLDAEKYLPIALDVFEKLAANYGDVPAQLLLEPLVVELSAEEKTALLSNLELLESAGLEIDDFGGNSVFLRSVPADVEQGSAEDLLVELADKLSKGSRDALSEKTEWVLHSISCRAAIKAGDKTSPQELMALAEKILSGEVPPFCPHGRPCVLKLTRKELEKQFGRIV